jgi:guanylate kinase
MGKIFTFSGPRGVGKTSIMDDLNDHCGIRPIVPYTTRDPRPNEVEGRDYHYVTDYEFDAIRRTRGMFDVLTLRGRKYGTPLEEFDRVIGGPNSTLEYTRTINLAAASAIELRKEIGEAAVKSIFILPECWNDIEQQMRDKGIPEEQILERRASEPTDLTMLPEFDRIVVNGYNKREEAFRNVAGYIARISGIALPEPIG